MNKTMENPLMFEGLHYYSNKDNNNYYGCYSLYNITNNYLENDKPLKFWKCKKFINEKDASDFAFNKIQTWNVKDKITGLPLYIRNGKSKLVVTSNSFTYFDKIKLMYQLKSLVKME